MVEGDQETHHGTRVVHKPPEDAGSQETVERGPAAQGEPQAPAETDHGTYHGAGFSGKRLGKPPPPQQLEPQTSAGRQAGAPQAAPPVMYCPSCRGQAEWLPNGQLWCSRCQSALVVGGDTVGAGRYILSFFLAGLIGLAVQYFLRYRGWLATWINLAIFTLTVIGTVALLAAAASSCYYDAYGNYICP